MNDIITDFLAQHFISLSFISRVAGSVYSLPKTKEITIPVATKIYTTNDQNEVICQMEQDYYDLIPDHREIGILYFEDEVGARVEQSNKRYNTWVGEVKLVFWCNTKQIGTEYSLSDLEKILLNSLPGQVPANGLFFGGSVNWSKENPRSLNPFKKYSYDEARTKYLSPPYGFFCKNIRYVVRAARNCPTQVYLNPELC